jgi:Cytochrome P460
MNRRFKIMLIVLLIALVSLGINALKSASGTFPVYASVEARGDDPEQVMALLAKYRTWTLVNPEPMMMDRVVSQMCALPMRDTAAVPAPADPNRNKFRYKPANPHQNKFLSVYVNETGREAMMTRLSPEFPQGSLIVKEKLGSKESHAPELLTAMLKREKGYNPESGDWEYMLLDGAASKIVERGRLSSCSVCHAAYSSTDYVTRKYLPDDVRSKLR